MLLKSNEMNEQKEIPQHLKKNNVKNQKEFSYYIYAKRISYFSAIKSVISLIRKFTAFSNAAKNFDTIPIYVTVLNITRHVKIQIV